MLQTAPFASRLTTPVADGDSLRYYPAYETPGRALLGARRGPGHRPGRARHDLFPPIAEETFS